MSTGMLNLDDECKQLVEELFGLTITKWESYPLEYILEYVCNNNKLYYIEKLYYKCISLDATKIKTIAQYISSYIEFDYIKSRTTIKNIIYVWEEI